MLSNLINPHGPFDAALQAALHANVDLALSEDVGSGDLTGLLVPDQTVRQARVTVREQAVLCGAPWFDAVMQRCHPGARIDWHYQEGQLMTADSPVCTIAAPARALLLG